MKIIWSKMKDVLFMVASALSFAFFAWLLLTALRILR